MKVTVTQLSHLFATHELWPARLLCPWDFLGSNTGVSSVQFSCSVLSNSVWPHGLQQAMLSCPSPTPGACSNSCPLSWWCHPTISSSVIPFSCPQSFPVSGFFPMNQFFASGGQSTGVSASASDLSVNIQERFPLGWTGWIVLSPRDSQRVFSNTTVQVSILQHSALFMVQLSHPYLTTGKTIVWLDRPFSTK